MELKTFVATTLHEIVEGVAMSQQAVADLGGAVNPSGDLPRKGIAVEQVDMLVPDIVSKGAGIGWS